MSKNIGALGIIIHNVSTLLSFGFIDISKHSRKMAQISLFFLFVLHRWTLTLRIRGVFVVVLLLSVAFNPVESMSSAVMLSLILYNPFFARFAFYIHPCFSQIVTSFFLWLLFGS